MDHYILPLIFITLLITFRESGAQSEVSETNCAGGHIILQCGEQSLIHIQTLTLRQIRSCDHVINSNHGNCSAASDKFHACTGTQTCIVRVPEVELEACGVSNSLTLQYSCVKWTDVSDVCHSGGDLTARSGYLATPGYPSNPRPPVLPCRMTIALPLGWRVRFYILDQGQGPMPINPKGCVSQVVFRTLLQKRRTGLFPENSVCLDYGLTRNQLIYESRNNVLQFEYQELLPLTRSGEKSGYLFYYEAFVPERAKTRQKMKGTTVPPKVVFIPGRNGQVQVRNPLPTAITEALSMATVPMVAPLPRRTESPPSSSREDIKSAAAAKDEATQRPKVKTASIGTSSEYVQVPNTAVRSKAPLGKRLLDDPASTRSSEKQPSYMTWRPRQPAAGEDTPESSADSTLLREATNDSDETLPILNGVFSSVNEGNTTVRTVFQVPSQKPVNSSSKISKVIGKTTDMTSEAVHMIAKFSSTPHAYQTTGIFPTTDVPAVSTPTESFHTFIPDTNGASPATVRSTGNQHYFQNGGHNVMEDKSVPKLTTKQGLFEDVVKDNIANEKTRTISTNPSMNQNTKSNRVKSNRVTSIKTLSATVENFSTTRASTLSPSLKIHNHDNRPAPATALTNAPTSTFSTVLVALSNSSSLFNILGVTKAPTFLDDTDAYTILDNVELMGGNYTINWNETGNATMVTNGGVWGSPWAQMIGGIMFGLAVLLMLTIVTIMMVEKRRDKVSRELQINDSFESSCLPAAMDTTFDSSTDRDSVKTVMTDPAGMVAIPTVTMPTGFVNQTFVQGVHEYDNCHIPNTTSSTSDTDTDEYSKNLVYENYIRPPTPQIPPRVINGKVHHYQQDAKKDDSEPKKESLTLKEHSPSRQNGQANNLGGNSGNRYSNGFAVDTEKVHLNALPNGNKVLSPKQHRNGECKTANVNSTVNPKPSNGMTADIYSEVKKPANDSSGPHSVIIELRNSPSKDQVKQYDEPCEVMARNLDHSETLPLYAYEDHLNITKVVTSSKSNGKSHAGSLSKRPAGSPSKVKPVVKPKPKCPKLQKTGSSLQRKSSQLSYDHPDDVIVMDNELYSFH